MEAIKIGSHLQTPKAQIGGVGAPALTIQLLQQQGSRQLSQTPDLHVFTENKRDGEVGRDQLLQVK